MRVLFSILIITMLGATLNAQTGVVDRVGKVSFVSSANIYVKFKSTEGINIGDTLYIPEGNTLLPALVVNGLSSVSCLCTSVNSHAVTTDHIVVARVREVTTVADPEVTEAVDKVAEQQHLDADTVLSPIEPARKQKVGGTISVNSYTGLSDTENQVSQRFRYTLSLNARHIGGSKFSFETHTSFNHRQGEWDIVRDNVFNALKIYNLSVRYDFSNSTFLTFGRKINPLISSMGSIDGAQFQKNIGNFSFGIIAGSRPDYKDYGFNLSLFQYGGWLGFSTKNNGKSSQSTIAYIEQTNDFATDRRFLYFQHSNSLIKNLSLFTSAEVDLFMIENGAPVTSLDLTGLYLSLSYRLSGKISISGAYDARKNVVYYETYKSFTDRILEDELRQGYRLSGSWRISRDMIMGVQAGYRFLKSDPQSSKSIRGYYTYNDIAGLNMTATLSGSYLMTSHSDLAIGGIDLSKDFAGGRFRSGIGYNYIINSLTEGDISFVQHMGEFNFAWYILEKLSLAVSYEGTFEPVNSYNSLYIQLRQRF